MTERNSIYAQRWSGVPGEDADWVDIGPTLDNASSWIFFMNQNGTSGTADGFYRIKPDGSGLQKIPTAPITPPDWPYGFCVSPEGARIAYVYNAGKVFRVQSSLLDASTAVTISAPVPNFAGSIDWNAQDRILGYAYAGIAAAASCTFDPDGSDVANLSAAGSEWICCGFSPDGDQVILVRGYSKPNYSIALISATGGSITTIVDVNPSGGKYIYSACWVNDRIYFLLNNGELWSCHPDGSDRHVEYTISGFYLGNQVWFSPSGHRLVVSEAASKRIVTASAQDGGDRFTVINNPFGSDTYVGMPTWRGETLPHDT